MGAHIKNRPLTHSVQSGQNAKGFFQHLLALYFLAEVKGEFHEARKEGGSFTVLPCTGCAVEAVATGLQQNQEFPGIDHFILICENQHGDTWRATYYLEYQVTTFVKVESPGALRRQYGAI